MISANLYKLSEYKIIEDENGALWWEAHAGIGQLRCGRCFLKGDILFIGAGKAEQSGFLKREFIGKLHPLPEWRKTRYYCLSTDIRTCRTGRKLTQEEMQNWARGGAGAVQEAEPSRTQSGKEYLLNGAGLSEDASYQLGHYEVVEKGDGLLRWKAHSGYSSVDSGKCLVSEDILFIGMKEGEESGRPKGEFLGHLRQLPEWSATRYYCPSGVLYDCRPYDATGNGEKIGRLQAGPKRKRVENRTGTTVHRKVGARKSAFTGLSSGIPRHVVKNWIFYGASFLLMLLGLVLSILVGFLNSGSDHRTERGHLSGRHRGH